jgi:hypothetical protein
MDMNRFVLSGPNSKVANKNVVIGEAFAFLEPSVMKEKELSWLAKLLGHKPGTPHIVSLAGPDTVDLLGVKITPLSLDRFFLQTIVCDKSLYRHGRDVVNLLVLCPLKPDSSVIVVLSCNEGVISRNEVTLGSNGEGSLKLRDLNVGDYQLHFEDQPEAACEIIVAEYRLVPLVASLTSSQALTSDTLDVVLHIESFGVAVNGAVKLNLMDRQTIIETVSAVATDGIVRASFHLKGVGPHTIAVQMEAEPSKTATVPLRGSREAERTNTVFSSLGNEVVGSLLPISSTEPVRGIYLKEGALGVSPITIDKVNDNGARFTVNADVSIMKVVVIDPTFPAARIGAIDTETAPHPESNNPNYKKAQDLFQKGKFAEACKIFEDQYTQFPIPHPYYAYWLACCYAKAGQVDRAVNWLRQSIVDGWKDFDHMATDEDLISLTDYEPFKKLLTGGRKEISFSNLAAGAKFEVDAVSPVALILIGAIINGKPWEGWTSQVTPSTVSAKVSVSDNCEPGAKITINFEAENANTSIYAIVKDARLISADTPELKLAAAIKNFVDTNGKKLSVGTVSLTLQEIWDLRARETRARGGFGSYGSSDMFGMAQLLSRSTTGQIFEGASDTWGGGTAPHGAWFGFGGAQQIPGGGGEPAAFSGNWDEMVTGSYTSYPPAAAQLSSPALPLAQAQSFAPAPGGSPLAAPPPMTPARKKATTSVSDDPEVFFAGFVPVRKGQGSLKIKLPDSFSNYIVECFTVSGMNWASSETRFTAIKDPFVQLTTPVFATTSEPGIGFVHVGSTKAVQLNVLCDGKPLELYTDNGSLFDGKVSGPQTSYKFMAGPGHYEATMNHEGVVVAQHQKRVDEPGKLKRAVRSLRVLVAGESIALKDEANLVNIQVLTGLENDFSLLLDATADYSHCCCEQTAAKIFSGCIMYLQATDDNRRKLGESIIIAGIKREESMWLRRQGFKSYPHMPPSPDNYYGPKAARYLWNLQMLKAGSGHSLSASLQKAIEKGLEMAEDTSSAYNIAWPPKTIVTCEDAYGALCFSPSADANLSLAIARAVEQSPSNDTPNPYLGVSVATRLDQSYAAATLLKNGMANDIKLALKLSNIVISQFNSQGRLYSTVDSVAAIALMTELQAKGITKGGGKLEINGQTTGSEEAVALTHPIKSLKVLEGAVTIAVDTIVEEDWKKFEAAVPLRISLERDGEHSREFTAGDTVDLVVTLTDGYKMGDLLWVALPDAFSRIVGGGQVKLFSLDFAGANQIRVSLAATGTTEAMDGKLQEQSLAVCVRNMFNEERAGNPGLIKVKVKHNG